LALKKKKKKKEKEAQGDEVACRRLYNYFVAKENLLMSDFSHWIMPYPSLSRPAHALPRGKEPLFFPAVCDTWLAQGVPVL